LLARFAGWVSADSYAAIFVAAFIIWQSLVQGKNSIDSLTDRFTSSAEYRQIQTMIAAIPGVEGVRLLRMRQSGPLTYIDTSVSVNRTLPASVGERIRTEIEGVVGQQFPESEISVAIRPIRTADESAFETIRLITSDFGILPHNIELSETEGAIIADLHIEFPPERSFEDAHEVSEEIERRICEEIPAIGKVYTHLEVERSALSTTPMHDLSQQESHLVEDVKRFISAIPSVIRATTDVAFFEHRETGEHKLVLTLELPSDLTLHDAHEVVTELERKLRKQYPNLSRVVIHTEPVALKAEPIQQAQ